MDIAGRFQASTLISGPIIPPLTKDNSWFALGKCLDAVDTVNWHVWYCQILENIASGPINNNKSCKITSGFSSVERDDFQFDVLEVETMIK
jgi:hypothetical protein